jgi:hypothetical protein
MPRSKTSRKRTHKRRRRGGGIMDYLPTWLGGTPSPSTLPPAPPSMPSLPQQNSSSLGGKSRRRRR